MPNHPGVLSATGPRRGRGPVRRLLIDNDWAGDPDGVVALTHHLLSTDRVDAVTSSLTSPMFAGSESGASRGLAMATDVVDRVAPGPVPVFAAGCEQSLARGGGPSPASRLIVAQANRRDSLPLVIVCAGPLSNVAAALQEDPSIAARSRLVWVGGSLDGDFEYNRDTDPEAAEVVFGSDLPIEQYPLEAYRACTYSLAELERDLAETMVGRLLWSYFERMEIPSGLPVGEVWHLGDSLPLLSTSLAPAERSSEHRVTHTAVDLRLLVGDMLAKFALHERARRRHEPTH